MTTVPPHILKQVKAIELRTRGLVAALFAGEYRSVFKGQGMEFAEVRPYEQGDDARSIDWNVSARFATPYVKTFTEERELTLLLLVDRSGSTRCGDPRAKVDVAVEVAAVLALAAARQHDRVGAVAFTDRIEQVIPPAKGRRHVLRIVRDLLAFQPTHRRTDLAGTLAYALRLLHHRSIVVVLSDFLAPGWVRPLRQLAARHEVVAVSIDDPREERLPAAGWIDAADAETDQHVLVDAGDRATRAQVAALTERRLAERAKIFATAGVEHLPLSTVGDYTIPLRRAFTRRHRGRNGR
ncbi:MAG: DUF58 domain-containing protein [Gemmatimonadota bacterium]